MNPFARMMEAAHGLMLRHTPAMITCQEFEAFIADYLDGALSARERRVFSVHLWICPVCRNYLAAYRRALETGRRAWNHPDDAVPDEVPPDLVRAILAARPAAGGKRGAPG